MLFFLRLDHLSTLEYIATLLRDAEVAERRALHTFPERDLGGGATDQRVEKNKNKIKNQSATRRSFNFNKSLGL